MSSSIFDAPGYDSQKQTLPFEKTRLRRDWARLTGGEDPNDMLIVITPSSKTSGSGSGKTTLATTICKTFDRTEGGFDAEKKATLDAGELAYSIMPEVEHGSAVFFDEAQGAPGTASVNARRGMTSEAIDAINAILANRDKALTVVVVAQNLGMLDHLLYFMTDAWLLITDDPSMPNGPQAVNHTLKVNDYEVRNPDLKTPAHEILTWSKIPHDDPDYRQMEEMKQQAKRKGSDEEEQATVDELPKPIRDKKICELYENDVPQGAIAKSFDLNQSTVSRIINDS